jgi:predicted hotdog family 3-hydroxylacyl-ACP dehydratase
MEPEADHILHWIPQRPPFVMIDRLIVADEKSSRSEFEVPAGNIFVREGRFTEPGLIENIAQTAAAGIGYICSRQQRSTPIGYIAAIQDLEIRGLPAVNERIQTEVVEVTELVSVRIVTGTVSGSQGWIARCSMKIFIKQETK